MGWPAADTVSESPPSISRTKRSVFLLLLIAATVGLTELCAWVSYRIIFGETFSFARIRAAQDASRRESKVFGFAPGATAATEAIHPYLGFVLNPRAVHTLLAYILDPGGHPPEQPRVNAYGFLGALSPIQKRSPDTLVVGILGGSMAQSLSRNGVNTLTAELHRYPRFADRRIVVVSAAVGGYKEPQQLMTLAYLLSLGAEFDIVINLDGFNEVALHPAENAAAQVFAAYPRGWPQRVQSVPEPGVLVHAGHLFGLQGRRLRWAEHFPPTGLRWSVTAQLLWRIRDVQLAREIAAESLALQRVEPDSASYAATGPPPRYQDEATMYEELVSLWKTSSFQLDKLCRANGIQYFHFLQPNQYVPGSKPIGEAERRVAYDANHPYRAGAERGYPLLVEAGTELARRGEHFRDLTMLFKEEPAPLYTDTCCHVNDRGNEMLAAAIAAAIVEEQKAADSDWRSAHAASPSRRARASPPTAAP